jgi:hypothetical protein
MSSRDLVHIVKATPAWAGATIATDTDTTSTIVIDTQGYESVMIAVHSGTITDGTFKLKILETDNADGTTGAAEVGSYQVQDSFVAASDDTVKKVGALTTKRYCTLRITSTGTTSGGVFKSGIALLGHARSTPIA